MTSKVFKIRLAALKRLARFQPTTQRHYRATLMRLLAVLYRGVTMFKGLIGMFPSHLMIGRFVMRRSMMVMRPARAFRGGKAATLSARHALPWCDQSGAATRRYQSRARISR